MLSARLARFGPTLTILAPAVVVAVLLTACSTSSAGLDASAAPPAGSATSSSTKVAPMEEERFWAVMATTASAGGTFERADRLTTELAKLQPREIAAFKARLVEDMKAIGTVRHLGAAEIMLGQTSQDAFVDFRAWVVSQGKDVHARFRSDPDSLVDTGIDSDEELGLGEMVGFAPDLAYENLTARGLVDDYPELPSPYGVGCSPDGPSYAQLAKELPRLAAAYLPSPVPEGNAFADGPRHLRRR